MSMIYQKVIEILGLLGIGAILNSVLGMIIDMKKVKNTTQHDFKQTRYKAIFLLMYASLDFDKHNKWLTEHNRNFANKEELMDELHTEWTNMILYASDKVVRAMKAFIEMPNTANYHNTILAMRKDLYGIRTKLHGSDLSIKK